MTPNLRHDHLSAAGLIRAEVDTLPMLNYSWINAGVEVMNRLTFANDGPNHAELNGLRVVIGEFGYTQQLAPVVLPAGASITIDPKPQVFFNIGLLANLPAPVRVKTDALLMNVPLNTVAPEIDILPPNAWHNSQHHEALAGFVLPHCDTVSGVIRTASEHLRLLTGGQPSFARLLNSESAHSATRRAAKAIYNCLQGDYRIAYAYEPNYVFEIWQAVRFPYDVLVLEQRGTCIDLVTLVAACLESVHIAPVIFLIEFTAPGSNLASSSHAIVGFFHDMWEGTSVVLSREEACELVRDNVITVIETTGVTSGQDERMTFEQAAAHARDLLRNALRGEHGWSFSYGIDIYAARAAGIMQMPFGRGAQWQRPVALAVHTARRLAREEQRYPLSARHLLASLLLLDQSLLRTVLRQLAIEPDAVAKTALMSIPPPKPGLPHVLDEGKSWDDVLRNAEFSASEQGRKIVTEFDLSQALVKQGGNIERVFNHHQLTGYELGIALVHLHNTPRMESGWASSGFIDA